MKLSDYKDEQALDLLAELIEPLSEILSDKEVRKAAEEGKKAKTVSVAIKNHKKEVMCVLAALDGVPVEEFHCNVLTLPVKLIEMLNDPDISQLFISAGQTEAKKRSGSLTENTGAEEQ